MEKENKPSMQQNLHHTKSLRILKPSLPPTSIYSEKTPQVWGRKTPTTSLSISGKFHSRSCEKEDERNNGKEYRGLV
jgi:hypothetical protein